MESKLQKPTGNALNFVQMRLQNFCPKEELINMSPSDYLFWGYIGGFITAGFILPWLDKKLKKNNKK